MNYNRVIIGGRLTRDPELRYTQSQMAVCKVGLAVNRKRKDSSTGEYVEEATFIDVTIFGNRAEAFEKWHSKGDAAFFEGSLRLDQWEDKNGGGKRSKLYVVADSWEFVKGGESGGSSGQQRQVKREPAPAQAAPGGLSGGDWLEGPTGAGGYEDVDDTPF